METMSVLNTRAIYVSIKCQKVRHRNVVQIFSTASRIVICFDFILYDDFSQLTYQATGSCNALYS